MRCISQFLQSLPVSTVVANISTVADFSTHSNL